MTILIKEDITLSSDTTYTDNLQVAAGVTITVNSGVTLDLGGRELLNYGTINLIGAENNLATIKNGTYSNDSTSGVFNSNLGKIESLTIDSFFNNGRLDFDSTVILNSNIEAYKNTNINNSLFQNSPFKASVTDTSVVVNKTTFKDSQVEIGSWIGSFQDSISFTESNFVNENTAIYLNPFFSGSGFSHNFSLTNSYIYAPFGSTFEDMVFDADDDLRVATDITSSGLQEEPYTNIENGFKVGNYFLSLSDLGQADNTTLGAYIGSSINDSIDGFVGYDLIDGGDGIDSISYKLSTASISFSKNIDGKLVINDSSSLPDTLSNIERIFFTDKGYALDIDGNGGIAAKAIIATFGVDSISAYMSAALSVVDTGTSLNKLCDLVVDLGLIENTIGSTDITAFVTKVYTNVISRTPTSFESAILTGYYDKGTHTRADLLKLAANSSQVESQIIENSVDLIGVAGSADGEILALQYDIGLG
jgi:hypothetical protein